MTVGYGFDYGFNWGSIVGVTTHVYDSFVALALKLIKKDGQAVTWYKNNEVANGTQPWKTTAGSDVAYPVTMVFLTPGGKIGNSEIRLDPGTSVPEGAPRALMGQVPFTPQMNDRVKRGSEWLMIKDVDIVAPNGEIVLYKIRYA